MRICDKCKTAKAIVKSFYREEDGKIYKVLVLSCRDRNCERYGEEEEIKQEIEILKGEN